jgi:hypothetical protein
MVRFKLFLFIFAVSMSLRAQLNDSLVEELNIIRFDDQVYRQMLDSVRSKYGRESPEVIALWHKQHMNDSVNLNKVIRMIDQHGYPGRSLVGSSLQSTAFLVIQHAKLAIQEQYIELLKEAANNKELPWSALALLIDRINTRRDQPQVYGTQVFYNKETAKYELFPIENEACVDYRRSQVGLRPLKDYASMWGMEYQLPAKCQMD